MSTEKLTENVEPPKGESRISFLSILYLLPFPFLHPFQNACNSSLLLKTGLQKQGQIRNRVKKKKQGHINRVINLAIDR